MTTPLSSIPAALRPTWTPMPEVDDENIVVRWRPNDRPRLKLSGHDVYWSSSLQVLRLIEPVGAKSFRFEIMHPTDGWFLPRRPAMVTRASTRPFGQHQADEIERAQIRAESDLLKCVNLERAKAADAEYEQRASARVSAALGTKVEVKHRQPPQYWEDLSKRDDQVVLIRLTKRQLREAMRRIEASS